MSDRMGIPVYKVSEAVRGNVDRISKWSGSYSNMTSRGMFIDSLSRHMFQDVREVSEQVKSRSPL